jgi:hypothetical protein
VETRSSDASTKSEKLMKPALMNMTANLKTAAIKREKPLGLERL